MGRSIPGGPRRGALDRGPWGGARGNPSFRGFLGPKGFSKGLWGRLQPGFFPKGRREFLSGTGFHPGGKGGPNSRSPQRGLGGEIRGGGGVQKRNPTRGGWGNGLQNPGKGPNKRRAPRGNFLPSSRAKIWGRAHHLVGWPAPPGFPPGFGGKFGPRVAPAREPGGKRGRYKTPGKRGNPLGGIPRGQKRGRLQKKGGGGAVVHKPPGGGPPPGVPGGVFVAPGPTQKGGEKKQDWGKYCGGPPRRKIQRDSGG